MTHLPSAVSILLNSLLDLPVAPLSPSLSLFFIIQLQMHVFSLNTSICSVVGERCSVNIANMLQLAAAFHSNSPVACPSHSTRFIINSTPLLYVIIFFDYDRLRYNLPYD
ncbi:hypothetical protein M405DRAFT_811574 [Rhizopogon salebrosus TDB-379]|nr:hypothetical protein M405DRAFT_811574 [Rhizopogon salebrosus TDB-379]